ncbi:hypothetical protein PILCRDRAFT_260251 [Piloderma croceum F 1598]|uniref:Uncharacterized protein n=1 Tax=Piloderma croceum (strain F 1598) TaxID=765440 RepID=A0A0C3BMQ6_PILCF|nr:hypothetical protein PILCRDRAFT_260251 [Piloderma croceum F 1598]
MKTTSRLARCLLTTAHSFQSCWPTTWHYNIDLLSWQSRSNVLEMEAFSGGRGVRFRIYSSNQRTAESKGPLCKYGRSIRPTPLLLKTSRDHP